MTGLADTSMTPERWASLTEYVRDVFGRQDEHLAGLMTEAIAEGLPDIAVSADVGRLLLLLTSMTRGRVAVEVGTLAGYSGIWIARGLAAGGRLITLEKEPRHAAFARRQFERAGVADRVQVREGEALPLLAELARELGPDSVDLAFIDAQKTEYPEYWSALRPLIVAGGLVLADNALGGQWWIDDPDHPNARAVDRFNRLVADDPEFDAAAVPLRSGVLIARRHS